MPINFVKQIFIFIELIQLNPRSKFKSLLTALKLEEIVILLFRFS